MNQAQLIPETKNDLHAKLMSHSAGLRNEDVLACMLASNTAGEGELPAYLGLDETQFTNMLAAYFPGVDVMTQCNTQTEYPFDRTDEKNELLTLLLSHRADDRPDTQWIAEIVVAGCMGGNHLWQDLGLWCRKDLTRMMEVNFPQLASKNDKNMKWKKFLYKQLCVQEGIYTCRSPSCEVCADYKECFSPE